MRLCTKHTIHCRKTFAVHQAHAIMYCTQQMIQGENFRDWLKNRENHESFPPRKFCRIRYIAIKILYGEFILLYNISFQFLVQLPYIANCLSGKTFAVCCNSLENSCGYTSILYSQSLLHKLFHWKNFAITDQSAKAAKLLHFE